IFLLKLSFALVVRGRRSGDRRRSGDGRRFSPLVSVRMPPPLVNCHDRIKHRFSSRRLSIIVKSLNDTQRGFLEKNGFGHLLDINWFSVPVPFMEWVMDHVIVDLSQFVHKKKCIKFTKLMVKQVFGIPSGNTPVILHSVDSNLISEFLRLKSFYSVNGDDKVSISHVTSLLLKDDNEESFMRSFMLIILSTILCPSTQNFVNLNYLYNLCDMKSLKLIDWYGHILTYILSEVKRYQGKVSSDEMNYGSSFYFGSCLPFLAIVYMDFLDLQHPDEECNHINYEVPRICNVRSEDFNFVMTVDRNSAFMDRNAYGLLNFRSLSSTPYDGSTCANRAAVQSPVDGSIPHDVLSENNTPPTIASVSHTSFEVDPIILPIVKKHCAILRKEFSDEIAATNSLNIPITNHMLPIFAKRLSLLSSDVYSLAISSQNRVNTSESPNLNYYSTPGPSRVNSHYQGTPTSSHFAYDLPNGDTHFTPANHDASCSSLQLSANNVTTTTEDGTNAALASASSPTGFNAANANQEDKTGSATFARRKRRKRHGKTNSDDESSVQLRVSADVEKCYRKPMFVVMSGYHASYEVFRKSLKPCGEVQDDVMGLYVRQFNFEHKNFSTNPLLRSKIAFSPFFSYKLNFPVDEFEPESIEAELTRINAETPISQADLLFLPMYLHDNWLLVVINPLWEEINVFDPFSASPPKVKDGTVRQVVQNFKLLCDHAEICNRNYTRYRVVSPSCSKISTLYPSLRKDSGIYIMMYIEYWDGRIMKHFNREDAAVFRKLLVHKLITSTLNEVKDPKSILASSTMTASASLVFRCFIMDGVNRNRERPILDRIEDSVKKRREVCESSDPTKVFIEAMKNLSEKQKLIVDELGFGSLLTLSCHKVPMHLYKWLADHFEVPTKTLKLPNGFSFTVNAKCVHNILGIPYTAWKIIDKGSEKWLQFIQTQIPSKGRTPTVEELIAMITPDLLGDDFARVFLLLALSSFLCPNTRNVCSSRYYYGILDVTSISDLDWCSLVLNWLVSYIQKYQDANRLNPCFPKGGCTMLLVVTYLEFLSTSEFKLGNIIPRLSIWTNSIMQTLSLLDSISSSPMHFGRLPLPVDVEDSFRNKLKPSAQLRLKKNLNDLSNKFHQSVSPNGSSASSIFANDVIRLVFSEFCHAFNSKLDGLDNSCSYLDDTDSEDDSCFHTSNGQKSTFPKRRKISDKEYELLSQNFPKLPIPILESKISCSHIWDNLFLKLVAESNMEIDDTIFLTNNSSNDDFLFKRLFGMQEDMTTCPMQPSDENSFDLISFADCYKRNPVLEKHVSSGVENLLTSGFIDKAKEAPSKAPTYKYDALGRTVFPRRNDLQHHAANKPAHSVQGFASERNGPFPTFDIVSHVFGDEGEKNVSSTGLANTTNIGSFPTGFVQCNNFIYHTSTGSKACNTSTSNNVERNCAVIVPSPTEHKLYSILTNHILQPGAMSLLQHKNFKPEYLQMVGVDPERSKIVHIPICVEKQWLLVVVNFINSTFDVLSPQYGTDQVNSVISSVVYNFKMFFIASFPNFSNFNIRDFTVRIMHVPKQEFRYDSGILVLHFIKTFNGNKVQQITNVDVQGLREKFLFELATYSYNTARNPTVQNFLKMTVNEPNYGNWTY
ncbi:hypothetical protein EJB05_43739, partial [Eragrostis curvula]